MFRRISKLFKSRAALGALGFALALWTYTSLNSEYITSIAIPIEVYLPSTRALESTLPGAVNLEVRGRGWNIFKAIFFDSDKKITIDLASRALSDSVFVVTTRELLQGVRNLEGLEVRQAAPDYLSLVTGRVGEIDVKVVPRVKITPRPGFVVIGEPSVSPDLILISGNRELISRVTEWPTQYEEYRDATKSFSIKIPLADTLAGIVRPSTRSVTLYARVEQAASMEFIDLPLIIRGGGLPRGHTLKPTLFSITVEGGVEQLSELTADDFRVWINYWDMLEDSTGIINPSAEGPKGIKITRISPAVVWHTVRSVK